MPPAVLEAIGYVGSALVLISFLMTSVVRLRIVNMCGSLISFVYALIVHALPLAIMNGALVLINLYFLWKSGRTKADYALLKMDLADPFLQHLLLTYQKDIIGIFPHVDPAAPKADTAYVILCEDAPAGVVLGTAKGKELDLYLDYSLPKYRDFSVGKFLKEKLTAEGFAQLRYSGSAENHAAYLKKMRFEAQADGSYLCRL